MLVAPVPRPVASSAYGFVRFFGGGLAPFVAGKIGDRFGEGWAFGLGAIAFALAIPVLASGHRLIERAESEHAVTV
jgi:MFS family permease